MALKLVAIDVTCKHNTSNAKPIRVDSSHQAPKMVAVNVTCKHNASNARAALTVETSPSEWTHPIMAPKMVAVNVTCKCNMSHARAALIKEEM
jgi:hypothetical protein